jgi:ABC-2 type transport system ATP-binding protein
LADGGVTFVDGGGRDELRVSVPAKWSNWMFFKLAEANGVAVRAIVRDDETLEELFLRTMRAA